MIDIDIYLTSLKASWVSKYITLQGSWKDVLKHYASNLGITDPLYLFRFNFKDDKLFPAITKLPKFYVQVLTSYNRCKQETNKTNANNYHTLTQPLWGNTSFLANGKTLFFPEFTNSNIYYLKDLVNEDGRFKSDNELYNTVSKKNNILNQIYILKNNVFNKFKNQDLSNAKHTKVRTEPQILFNNKYYNLHNLKSKFFYLCLISKQTSRGNMKSIWARNFNFTNSNTIWRNIYSQKIIKLKISKIAEFNYKVLHTSMWQKFA